MKTEKIICGDAFEVLKEIESGSIDLIITSPPYNFGRDYDSINDLKDWKTYFDSLVQIFTECKRVLKTGGRLCINIQPCLSLHVPTHHIISQKMLELDFLWYTEIIWEKSHFNCKLTAWGSWKSPSQPHFKTTWEFIEVFSKGTLKKKGPREKIDITSDEFKKWVNPMWKIAPEVRMKAFGHPAMFPEELVRRLIKLFSYKEDLVLDPFNGVGTTTKVAKELGRNFIGIDISKKYCEIAKERLKIQMNLFQGKPNEKRKSQKRT